jgi:prevent-host-death family protein
MEVYMNLPTWPVQDAKARFSELLDTCVAQGPQMVTKRGAEAAVLVPVAQWRRMQTMNRPSLKELLMTDEGRGELVLPERGQDQHRPALDWA